MHFGNEEIEEENSENKTYLSGKDFIKRYILIVLCMGFFSLPLYKFYWSNSPLFEIFYIKNILSRTKV